MLLVRLADLLEEAREVLLPGRAGVPPARNAFRADATAASISAGPARWTSAKGSPVGGFTALNVLPVSTSWPSMMGLFAIAGASGAASNHRSASDLRDASSSRRPRGAGRTSANGGQRGRSARGPRSACGGVVVDRVVEVVERRRGIPNQS